MIRLGVIGSGSGTNFQSILDAIDGDRLDAEVACVLCDVPDARILERASARDIPAYYIDCAPFRTKLDGKAEQQAVGLLGDHRVDVVVLAGFMRIVKQGILGAFRGRIVNIHPSLLPAFPGLEAWRQALDYGAKITGCTVHFVDEGMDTGPIILQIAVPILDSDSPETLHARIQAQEHIAYPEALEAIARGELTIRGRGVTRSSSAGPSGP